MVAASKPRKVKRTSSAEKSDEQVKYSLLKSILDHVADPIFVKDRRHRLIYGNRALSEMIGMPQEKYLNKTDHELFPKEEVDVFWERDNRVFETGEVDLNEEHLTDSHGKRHVLSTKKSRCMISENDSVIVGITRDVTQIKEIERLKSDFLAMISHELRTPLTSIDASLELLESGVVSKLPAAVADMIKIAYRNSQRLVGLVNEILDIEKIEAAKLNLNIDKILLRPFLLQTIEENKSYGEKYGTSFELGDVAESCYVLADQYRLMQVITNLLSNAAKYSTRGSRVVVSARQKNGGIALAVRDYGSGISENFKSRIFEKFSQGDDYITSKHNGTGLGLYITKKMVEAMNGTISFESTVGKGTTFYVELPMTVSRAEKPKTERKRATR